MSLAMLPTVGGDRVKCQVLKHKNLTVSRAMLAMLRTGEVWRYADNHV